MGISRDILDSSADERIKTLRENFPEVYDGVIGAMDSIVSSNMKMVDERVRAVERSQQNEFQENLTRQAPDWESTFAHPSWPTWLAQKDRYNMPRVEALRAAKERFDVSAVANLVSDFKRELGLPSAPRPSPGSPSSSNPAADDFIPASYVKTFYEDVARGRYKFREKEVEAIRARIDRAAQAGKIVEGR